VLFFFFFFLLTTLGATVIEACKYPGPWSPGVLEVRETLGGGHPQAARSIGRLAGVTVDKQQAGQTG
jgi:hypothetical protein